MDIILIQVMLEFLNILEGHGLKWGAILMEKNGDDWFGSVVSINSNGDKIMVSGATK